MGLGWGPSFCISNELPGDVAAAAAAQAALLHSLLIGLGWDLGVGIFFKKLPGLFRCAAKVEKNDLHSWFSTLAAESNITFRGDQSVSKCGVNCSWKSRLKCRFRKFWVRRLRAGICVVIPPSPHAAPCSRAKLLS